MVNSMNKLDWDPGMGLPREEERTVLYRAFQRGLNTKADI